MHQPMKQAAERRVSANITGNSVEEGQQKQQQQQRSCQGAEHSSDTCADGQFNRASEKLALALASGATARPRQMPAFHHHDSTSS
jgi:hypothetical protein